MDALYLAFAITWIVISLHILYLIRNRSRLKRELARMSDLH